MKQQQYNVGIYVRLSKDDERAGESLSIENQKLILCKYVSEQNWNLTEIYVDDGYSGVDFDRPSVKRLIEDAENGKINLIICKDLSRFARNYVLLGQYIDYEQYPIYRAFRGHTPIKNRINDFNLKHRRAYNKS